MLSLLPETTTSRLLSLSMLKKMAFVLLVFERMLPQLEMFCKAEKRDFRVFQAARDQFWGSLFGLKPSLAWADLKIQILDATPDSEKFESLLASFALNAALVAADAAELAYQDNGQPVLDAIGNVKNSLDAMLRSELPLELSIDSFNSHELTKRERTTEEADVIFLNNLREPPWAESVVRTIRERAKTQLGLLEYLYV